MQGMMLLLACGVVTSFIGRCFLVYSNDVCIYIYIYRTDCEHEGSDVLPAFHNSGAGKLLGDTRYPSAPK